MKKALPAIVFGLVSVLALSAQSPIIREGIESFSRSDFDAAILRFREALLDATDGETEASAYFWTAKAAMALNQLDEAERNLEFYLQNFPDHEYVAEAEYQRGRLLFMREDYEQAIIALGLFVDENPDSPFAANAVYWAGESLFAVGRFDDAKRLFETVLRDYPTSYRVEAARYRIAVIELSFRERELLSLLQWSHEEYLQALDDFDRRERAYQEAIASYQQRLAAAATEDFREEIIRLTTQVRTLQEQIRSRDAQIARLEEQVGETDSSE